MAEITPPSDIPRSEAFDELLESRLQRLLNHVGSVALEEVEAELRALQQIIANYKCNDELLEGLRFVNIEGTTQPDPGKTAGQPHAGVAEPN